MSKWVIEYAESREAVHTAEQLCRRLLLLCDQVDPNLDLIHESGDYLSISVKGPWVLVRFTRGTLDPPYLSASVGAVTSDNDGAYFEFLIGDTPTPVPRDRCVSIKIMLRIAQYFFEHEALPDWIEWKED